MQRVWESLSAYSPLTYNGCPLNDVSLAQHLPKIDPPMDRNATDLDTTYAYLAGVIDFSGYILIRRVVIGHETRYIPVIGVSANASAIPDLFQSVFPGIRQQFQPKTPKHRPVHWWEAKHAHARRPLCCLLPHLRVKQNKAKLTLSMLDLYVHNRGTPTDDQWAARQRIYDEVLKLNGPRVGRQINRRSTKLDADQQE